MAEDRAKDWAADVRKYAADADDAAIAGIVRYCGIALRKRDSSLVSMGDPKETGRVRENFLKKKLGRTEADEVLDAAIAAVGETMRAENFKHRVTVYYLLADRFGALDLFRKAPKAASPAAEPQAPAEDHKLADTIAAVVHDAGAVAGAVAGAFAGTGIGAGAVAGNEAAELAAEEVAPDLADRAHDPAPAEPLASMPEVQPTVAADAAGGTGSLWLWLVLALVVIAVVWLVFGRG